MNRSPVARGRGGNHVSPTYPLLLETWGTSRFPTPSPLMCRKTAHEPSRDLVNRDSAGAIVLALAIPVLFVHERYQPALELDWRSTSLDFRLSDAAVLLVLVAAIVSAARLGSGRLGAARIVWLPGIALMIWLAFQAFRPVSIDDARFEEHLVSFLKFGEYALLAPAVPLLVRRSQDLAIVLGSLVLWASVATTVALVQFFGVDVFDAWNPGWRQPSFLGHHDLAALSALAAALAVAGIVCGARRLPTPRLFVLALLAGALGLIVAGSLAAAAGFAVGALAATLIARSRIAVSSRRFIAMLALVAVVAAGVTAIRADSLEEFVRFLGISEQRDPEGVETYSQRTVLAYIGVRIWEDNPIFGVGWQRSSRAEVFESTSPTRARSSPTSSTRRSPRRDASGACRTSTSRCSRTRERSALCSSSPSAQAGSCWRGGR